MKVALVVPVMKNFKGFTELMHSVDHPVLPVIVDNWNENHGVSWAWNYGISKAMSHSDLVIVCNDDVEFYPGTINRLISHIEFADLVTPTNTRDEPTFEGVDGQADFSCFMINPRKFVSKFGWFDEHFFPAYFEDNDMAYRIKLAGGKLRRVGNAPMLHRGSVTQNMDGKQVVDSPTFEQNRAYYISKWGGMPGKEKYTTPFGR